jgi:hypothetical protein
MSYVGAIPVDSGVGAVSESHLPIIDAALASVRKNAGLDEETVLPPLEVLAPKPPPFRVLMTESVHQLPSAEAIVRTAVTANASSSSSSSVPVVADRNKQTSPGLRKRTFAQRMRWPVFLCGFVAGIFGGVAVMKSPVGQKPAVRSVVVKVQSSAGKVFFAAKTRASR